MLSRDDEPDEAAPAERGRGGWQSSDDGSYGSRTRDDQDERGGYGRRSGSARGSGGGSRGYDDSQDQDEERYVPHRQEEQGPGARPPARRSAGPRPPFAPSADKRSIDPLDDPRAPRSLRKSQPAPRQAEPRRGSYGAGDGNDGYGGGGYGGYEHEGRRYRNGDPGYDPRYDPESGEYDAVADRRRRGERAPADDYDAHGRGGYGRHSGGPRDERSDGAHGRQGGGWDEREDRRSAGQGARGGYSSRDGYGGYGDAPSAEYSAEYPARYNDAPSAEYSAEYSAELQARGGYGRDYDRERRDYRGGYQESAAWDAYPPRGRPAPNYPPEDSWNLPAISEAQLPATGWTGDWNAAQPMGAPDMPARSGRGAGRGDGRPASKRKRSRGVAAVVVGLVVLVAMVVVIIGVSQRSAILERLPGGAPQTNAHPFATYTPGPTPTPVPNYKEFSSDNALYVLNYPAKWVEQTSNQPNTGYDYVDTFIAQNPYAAVIVEQAAAFANISDADIVTAEINGGKQAGRTFTAAPGGPTTVAIGGEQWTRDEFDVSDGTTKLHMAVLTCHHKGRGYAIVLVATPDTFAQDDTTVFKTVLNSFRFAS